MKLAAGIAPVPALLAAGITVGLGTDGCASNNNLDLFQEMDTAAKLHKVNGRDPTVLTVAAGAAWPPEGAPGPSGWPGCIGSIETGKQADLLVVDTNAPGTWCPCLSPASQPVYSARRHARAGRLVAGRVLRAPPPAWWTATCVILCGSAKPSPDLSRENDGDQRKTS